MRNINAVKDFIEKSLTMTKGTLSEKTMEKITKVNNDIRKVEKIISGDEPLSPHDQQFVNLWAESFDSMSTDMAREYLAAQLSDRGARDSAEEPTTKQKLIFRHRKPSIESERSRTENTDKPTAEKKLFFRHRKLLDRNVDDMSENAEISTDTNEEEGKDAIVYIENIFGEKRFLTKSIPGIKTKAWKSIKEKTAKQINSTSFEKPKEISKTQLDDLKTILSQFAEENSIQHVGDETVVKFLNRALKAQKDRLKNS